MKHTCQKCEACGKASFEQLMACNACQEEIDNKIKELEDDGATVHPATGETPVHDDLPRVRRVLDPGPKKGRFTKKRPADIGDERGGAS